jgi:hypothetical protein
MVADDEGDGRVSFSRVTKCCTYLPEIANFAVGAIFSGDTTTAGQESVRRRIANRVSVTPLGIGQPPHALDPRSNPPVFGKDVAYLCDHHADGCSIWKDRDSVCATYFCKMQRGAVGLRFWSALRAALATVERAVARGCLLRIGLGASELAALQALPAKLGLFPSVVMGSETYRAVWGRWTGREEELYAACARAAEGLSWEDIEHCGGAELAIAAEAARHAHAELLAPVLPQHPVSRPFTIHPSGPDSVRVVGYSLVDPIELPPAVIAALGHFDGRPLADAVQAARERQRVGLGDELLQTLADFGLIGESFEEA